MSRDTRPDGPESEFEPDKVVVRDKRRFDPATGALREQAPAATSPAEAAAAYGAPETPSESDTRITELTDSLARTQAEYANYRKRVERDRQVDSARLTAGLLVGLLPMLDDVERAREHGDLTGGFKSVGEALEALTSKLGLERFGEAGDAFDPTVHEAVMQAEADEGSSVATCAQVFQPGFRVGGLVLRPARVSVSEGTGTPVSADDETPAVEQE